MSQSKYKQRLANAFTKIQGAQNIYDKNEDAFSFSVANDALGNACMLITDSLVELALRAAGKTDREIESYLDSSQNTSMVKLNVAGKILKSNAVSFNDLDALEELLETRHFSVHEAFEGIERDKLVNNLALAKRYYTAAHKLAYAK